MERRRVQTRAIGAFLVTARLSMMTTTTSTTAFVAITPSPGGMIPNRRVHTMPSRPNRPTGNAVLDPNGNLPVDMDSASTTIHQSTQPQHLVLIGGGHAHIQVIKALVARPAHVHVTLIDSVAAASYSGMVPGCIAGFYEDINDTLLQLQPLARWAGCKFIQDTVVDVDLERQLIYLPQQRQQQNRNDDEINPIAFDVLSIDIGSTSKAYRTTPGAAQYAIPTRPIHALVTRLDHARHYERHKISSFSDATVSTHKGQDKGHERGPSSTHLVIVGGGVAGIELAMVIQSRWKRDGIAVQCTILNSGPAPPTQSSVLDGTHHQANAPDTTTLADLLQSKDIVVRFNSHVVRIDETVIHLAHTDETVPYTQCVWATGAEAHGLAHHLRDVRGLDCDAEHGWITVHPTLQSTSHANVFAAGDCAGLVDTTQPPFTKLIPKAGVYAVRAGPILIENLTRYLQATQTYVLVSSSTPLCDTSSRHRSSLVLQPYEPQNDFMKLLVCGDGTAIGFRFGLVFQGKWVLALKDHIDRSFMNLFDVSLLPSPDEMASPGRHDTRQYDSTDTNETWVVPLPPDEAASLLQRTDDAVDYRQAQAILRAMGHDKAYQQAVLQHARRATTAHILTSDERRHIVER